MNTQQYVDLDTARKHAAETGLDCKIEAEGSDFTITMETGEVETVTGLPGAIRVIESYAALG